MALLVRSDKKNTLISGKMLSIRFDISLQTCISIYILWDYHHFALKARTCGTNEERTQLSCSYISVIPSGFFVPGFPKLMRFQEHHDRILKKTMPKLKQHLVRPPTLLQQWRVQQALNKPCFQLFTALALLRLSWGHKLIICWSVRNRSWQSPLILKKRRRK